MFGRDVWGSTHQIMNVLRATPMHRVFDGGRPLRNLDEVGRNDWVGKKRGEEGGREDVTTT